MGCLPRVFLRVRRHHRSLENLVDASVGQGDVRSSDHSALNLCKPRPGLVNGRKSDQPLPRVGMAVRPERLRVLSLRNNLPAYHRNGDTPTSGAAAYRRPGPNREPNQLAQPDLRHIGTLAAMMATPPPSDQDEGVWQARAKAFLVEHTELVSRIVNELVTNGRSEYSTGNSSGRGSSFTIDFEIGAVLFRSDLITMHARRTGRLQVRLAQNGGF